MTPVEYAEKIQAVRKEAESKIKAIQIEYAEKNNPVKIGDMVSNQSTNVKVETIGIAIIAGLPSMVYHGPAMTKKGNLFKSGKRDKVYQVNLQIINGEQVNK